MDPIARMVAAGAAGAAGGSSSATYVDDVFSTFLYEGNGSSTQAINNGIDLAGEGGMTWVKCRSDAADHRLIDTERGAYNILTPNATSANFNNSSIFSSFNNDGFSVASDVATNGSNRTYASWSFRKAPGFFDIVTYSGTGSAHSISHSLGSVPGMILYKPIDDTREWMVYHRSLGASQGIILNMNIAAFSSSDFGSGPTSTHFSVGNTAVNNTAGKNYVAYIFAHDDQSFGTNSDEAIIKCGTYTGAANTVNSVELGFEPQWLMIKNTSRSSDSYGVADWWMGDIMREMSHSNARALRANTNDSEYNGGKVYPTSTGFVVDTEDNIDHSTQGDTYIYMAIRRPNKPPTAGTEVFAAQASRNAADGTPSELTYTSNFPVDLMFNIGRAGNSVNMVTVDRLRGNAFLRTSQTDAETSSPWKLDTNAGVYLNGSYGATSDHGGLMFKRTPGFFDAVAYTGGSTTYTHNLEAVPELMIIKVRNGGGLWYVYSSVVGNSKFLRLNGDNAESTGLTWTTPTATEFTAFAGINASHEKYIAYLFASLDGISKVSSYTGTGSNINVDCGFTSGARFILIKRTDSSGDWYFWDTARGIVSGNDPYLLFNSTAAEVTNTDYIDPLNAGFTVTSSAPAALNASGGTYLFLAIA